MVITSPTTYCLVSIATTLTEQQQVIVLIVPSFYVQVFSSVLPLQVGCVDGLVADGTLGPALVAQTQVAQHARPAEDVAAASDARCQGRVQADGARGHLMAVDALQAHTRGTFVKCTKEEFKIPSSALVHR